MHLTRRQFIEGGGTVALLLAGCGPRTDVPKPKSRSELGIKDPWDPPENPKAELMKEVGLLSPGPIKSLLETRALRYFQQPTPFMVNFAGVDVRVHYSKVVYASRSIGTANQGSITLRESGASTGFTVAGDQTLRFPLVAGVMDDEKTSFPPNYILPDGTPSIEREFKDGNKVENGLAPVITVIRSNQVPAEYKAQYLQFERFTYIKELCGMLLGDALLQESGEKMRDLGMPLSINARSAQGAVPIEALSNLLGGTMNQGGRLLALTDLAAYIVAFKAAENSNLLTNLKGDIPFVEAVDLVKGVSLGTTLNEVLHRSFETVLNNPILGRLHHVGDMSKLP